MSDTAIVNILQSIVSPVIMVTSASILLGGILGRYGAVNDRLRAMAHERLTILLGPDGVLKRPEDERDPLRAERLRQIDAQLPGLLSRHQLLHNAAVTIYAAIAFFVIGMFLVAAALFVHYAWIAVAAVLDFLAGTGVLLLGVMMVVVEVRRSNIELRYEVERVSGLWNPDQAP
jgi:energy-converting hydrogenase Eha subunit C